MSNIANLVNDLITQAIKLEASDIHVEPKKDFTNIRLRIDGVLQETRKFQKDLHASIISRIKILSDINIADQRNPHDGRIHIRLNKKELDLRVSIIPTINGEKAVIRLLQKEMALLTLEELGMEKNDYETFLSLVKKPHGIIIATGPTGSGKTTTLYAALNKINSKEKNILTIEDPVEYEIEGISQMHVNLKSGLNFAKGLRAILRQDPDVIMIGEIRDEETARIAVSAAMTGHLVLTTMHTNDSVSAITRLLDLKIEPYLVASSIAGIISQRLLRVLCVKCIGKGCDLCSSSGFKGRTGVFETLRITEEIRKLIRINFDEGDIRKTAKIKRLQESGIEKAMQGLTTKQEVFRSIHSD